jgi:ribosomal protein S5
MPGLLSAKCGKVCGNVLRKLIFLSGISDIWSQEVDIRGTSTTVRKMFRRGRTSHWSCETYKYMAYNRLPGGVESLVNFASE